MKCFSVILLAAGVLVAGCDKKDAASTSTNTTSGNPLTAPIDYVGAVVNAQNVALKTADLASLKSAIQQFKAQEDRFPKSLDELISQKYLPKLPQTPAGTKLQYDAASGVVSIVKG